MTSGSSAMMRSRTWSHFSYVPFQPNTEVQFDAPSTLQFLFNGAYAEKDRF